MIRTVYADGRQFNTVEELTTAIIVAWDAGNEEIRQKMVRKMRSRSIKLIKAHEAHIKY